MEPVSAFACRLNAGPRLRPGWGWLGDPRFALAIALHVLQRGLLCSAAVDLI
jgi:hypothetical protein